MESLKENKPLLYSIIFSSFSVFALAYRIFPDTSDQFQIVEIADEVRIDTDLFLKILFNRFFEIFFSSGILLLVLYC